MKDEHKLLEGPGLAVTQRCQGRVWGGELEGMQDISNASLDVINGGGHWHWDLAGEPRNSVSDALGLGFIGPHRVAPIGVHGGTKVPTINAMWCPTVANARLLMDDDAGIRRSNECAVEVEGTVELCPCR